MIDKIDDSDIEHAKISKETFENKIKKKIQLIYIVFLNL